MWKLLYPAPNNAVVIFQTLLIQEKADYIEQINI